MDKSWMETPRHEEKFRKGVEKFVEFAVERSTSAKQLLCPCSKCCFSIWLSPQLVNSHLVIHGFTENYINWYIHGERTVYHAPPDEETSFMNERDDMEGLTRDAGVRAADKDPEYYNKIREEAKEPLYPGCKTFSVISFLINLYLIKAINGWSNSSFEALLKVLIDAFPEAKIPDSFYKVKKKVSGLGLEYTKIDACPRDCMLFRGDYVDLDECLHCGASRWSKIYQEVTIGQEDEAEVPAKRIRKIPAKVLRHFPLIPRLQRLFECSKTAGLMRWHQTGRVKDGMLRHPADGRAWKHFDDIHPEFAEDSRNVRLGLSTDGFNPFSTMTISHSIWPVILFPYNLPHWLYMKSEYLMMCLLIPGPQSPGQNIDVYLQPLIEELKILWETGIETKDASTGSKFMMRGALLWTISDFPAYSMLSGLKTKGRYACPCCNFETRSHYLKRSRKMCFMGHRRFLDGEHKWRREKKRFDGKTEFDPAPEPLTGKDISMLGAEFEKQKKAGPVNEEIWPCKKNSIFFQLPYWEDNSVRHNLDVMHIEKNIVDSIFGTLLGIQGKTKDHVNARFDLVDLGIRQELQPIESVEGKKTILPKAPFSLSNEGKELFCKVFKDLKLPDGCASNISRCVNMQEKKIAGYKSHDAHFALHYILPVAVRHTLPKHVGLALTKLSAFFRAVCSKVIDPKDLDQMQSDIVEIICLFEMIFLPCFFDIMVHLPVHLVNEIRQGGPVNSRWMYPTERFQGKLKGCVTNRSRPEGSIAESYLGEECLNFCSRYLNENTDTNFNRPSRNEYYAEEDKSKWSPFVIIGRPIGAKKNGKGKIDIVDEETLERAHRYVLFNCEDLEEFRREHKNIKAKDLKKRKWEQVREHNIQFSEWFKKVVSGSDHYEQRFKDLARGPNFLVYKYSGYIINGYRFSTQNRDRTCKTQNCGVQTSAMTEMFSSSKDSNPVLSEKVYYGDIVDIIELDYYDSFKVVLFRCKWYKWKKDEYGLIWVNKEKFDSKEEPFIEASQVKQVFYVNDPKHAEKWYVMQAPQRELFDLEDDIVNNDHGPDDKIAHVPYDPVRVNFLELEGDMTREDVEATVIDQPIEELNKSTFMENPNLETVDEDDFDDSEGAIYKKDDQFSVDELSKIMGEELLLDDDVEYLNEEDDENNI